MKLRKLLKNIPIKDVKGSKEIEISGICSNSKRVAPGNLFVAKRGFSIDGTKFIPEAISTGAVAVLTDLYDPSLREITQLIDSDVKRVEADLAAHYYNFPSDALFVTGITGTNGKTTTSFIVKHLLDQLDLKCGLIGTIEHIIGEHRYQASNTTPDVISNHKMLREMVLNGCKAAVMEVTSHALDQKRVQNIHFDVALFTNLTLDHLDYHQTMEKYCAAKNQLFKMLNHSPKKKKAAVVNGDSPWSAKITEGCIAPLFTYGIDNPHVNLRAHQIDLQPQGSSFVLSYLGQEYPCNWSIIGRHNIYNCLAALSVGIIKGFTLEKMIAHLPFIQQVPGRLERVINPLNLNIYVDFAHSDDSLSNVLKCLSEFKKEKLITVFGCGGDRDRTKRPKMAKAAGEFSDYTIVTSDNPRSEDPHVICKEITSGFLSENLYEVEVDRKKAIEKAIRGASQDDIILIAGKGHEPYQIFSHKTIAFDDRKIAFEICEQLDQKR